MEDKSWAIKNMFNATDVVLVDVTKKEVNAKLETLTKCLEASRKAYLHSKGCASLKETLKRLRIE